MSCHDSIHFYEDECTSRDAMEIPFIYVGNKRMRVSIELCDSNDEFDAWQLHILNGCIS